MYMFVYFVRFRSNLAWAIPVNEDTPPWKTNIGTFPQENKPTGLLPFESNEVIGIELLRQAFFVVILSFSSRLLPFVCKGLRDFQIHKRFNDIRITP